MALIVPEPQIVHIRKFLELPDDKIEAFLDALAKAGPQFNAPDLSDEVSTRLEISKRLIGGIVSVLASLYRTWDGQHTPIETFVDQEVYAALKKAEVFSGKNVEAQWAKLRKFLIAALSLESTVGTAAKAGYVHTQHERIFVKARILTDLRPIFHQNVSEKPEAAVIVHMLRITQRDTLGNKTEKYFALDSNDIMAMRELIERALRKEETLKSLMKDAGVTILPPKFVF
ncbi:MAG: hypothetical protein HY313_11350 [Acidobacteria bacterium]|nr:hypothetical protein [Acidobacteriota bacterium]